MRGLIRDAISSISTSSDSSSDSDDGLRIFQEAQILSRNLAPYHTGEDSETVAWKTIIGNRNGRSDPPPQSWGGLYDKALDIFGILKDNENGTEERDDVYMQYVANVNFFSAADQMLSARRLCVTDKRYIGIVPDTVDSGDEICIIPGGAVILSSVQQAPAVRRS